MNKIITHCSSGELVSREGEEEEDDGRRRRRQELK
jgi:hypothetical protein